MRSVYEEEEEEEEEEDDDDDEVNVSVDGVVVGSEPADAKVNEGENETKELSPVDIDDD